ncbi:hexaprenyldihydroxybenzoate methyltransferase [Galdieria sulphuraria]|uniref:Ubiquinone biosynthesis O-methyltransferase, mitochondrial n=1 Tax=Galdieria sulphuraria TaxID=130081 RepID=M2X2V2_GALSU|nr:hexaprenyldihydroxybenzoate methyltransferase [Galdieria sulphuraria]EME30710.1 hexaprenyldihydroxybenzoate methyltransferase [Galdieria sulphuraria]|eukprot:XP_005707230.1 hexaprenyldihydroxybenzoate methyltransferase [Galdieria sulphuraria]
MKAIYKKILQKLRCYRHFSEVAKFNQHAKEWWSLTGPVAPLLRFNPARVAVIRAAIEKYSIESKERRRLPLQGISILDVGCGGGILCEPLGRLGASVLGIDEAEDSIKVARKHASLDPFLEMFVKYRLCSLSDLVSEKVQFDCVTCLEVIEHVDEPQLFLHTLAQTVRPQGLLIISTINRTITSWLTAIFMAENILGWIPKGTHQWQKLVRPEEITSCLSKDMKLLSSVGFSVDPFDRNISLTRNLGTNYMMVWKKCSSNENARKPDKVRSVHDKSEG